MAYTFNLIYGLTYTRNNQVVFPENFTGVKIVTQTCSGNFFTFQRTLRAVITDIITKTPLKTIVGARVLPNDGTDDEYYYFINGYTVIAPNVVEFNIEPDYFHTYLKLNDFLRLHIERTNIGSVYSDTTAFFKPVTAPRQDQDPVVIKSITTPLTNKGYYERYAAVLYALGSERTIYVISRTPDATAQPDTLYNLIKATKITGTPIVPNSQPFEKNIKALRAFWLPRQLATILINAGDDVQNECVWYGTGDKDYIRVVANYYGKVIAEYSDVVNLPDKAKYYTVGTLADNISVKANYHEKDQVPKVKVNLKLDTNSCSILLRIGEREIDCTRGFEYDCNVDEYVQQLSQVGISNAIQKVGNVAAAAGSVGAGIAAANTGNFLQAALNITSGLTALGKQLSADYELKNKVTATSGNNIGTICWAAPYYGIAVLEYSAYDENEVNNYTNLFGAEVNGYEYDLYLNSITARVFIQARKVEFLNMGIPAPAAVELEQTFISGIFISPFIAQ